MSAQPTTTPEHILNKLGYLAGDDQHRRVTKRARFLVRVQDSNLAKRRAINDWSKPTRISHLARHQQPRNPLNISGSVPEVRGQSESSREEQTNTDDDQPDNCHCRPEYKGPCWPCYRDEHLTDDYDSKAAITEGDIVQIALDTTDDTQWIVQKIMGNVKAQLWSPEKVKHRGERLDALTLVDNTDDTDNVRPEDCGCWGQDALPCWPCWRDGFRTPTEVTTDG